MSALDAAGAGALNHHRDLVTEMAGQPRIVADLLARHVDDGTGCCTVCRTTRLGALPWPCSLAATAAGARRLIERRGHTLPPAST